MTDNKTKLKTFRICYQNIVPSCHGSSAAVVSQMKTQKEDSSYFGFQGTLVPGTTVFGQKML